MTDPNLIHSDLSRQIILESHTFEIEIYRLEHTDWSLEVIDEDGSSTVWDDLFETDQAALKEALKTNKDEGIGAFRDSATVIPFQKPQPET